MRILGLVFAGSSASNREEMTDFLRNTLSLEPTQVEGVEADLFTLPDGSTFAVASPAGMGDTPRSIGFLVDNLTEAAETLRASGATVGPIAENAQERYLHFRAPDAQLYELIERKASTPS